ncbi:MAG TPA: hypothetical protein PKN32_07725 [Bacteroidales bacterium]|nr:hypothetical protein [Bacteroidales bacterium]
MKKALVFILLIISSFAYSQYQVGFGFYLNTISPLRAGEFTSPGTNSFELSIKAVLPDYQCWDFMGGWSKNDFRFTIMKEVHRQLFYPVDLYLGLGFHIGVWNKNYMTTYSGSKFYGGLDGDFGLQFTFLPISFSVGMRPVWNFLGTDNFVWIKQVGIRFCY